MFGRITIVAITIIGIFIVVIVVSVNYLPVYYHSSSLQVVKEKPIAVTSPAWAIFSLDNCKLIFSKNENEIMPIASVTKLVTAATLLENYDMFYPIKISWLDVASEGRAGELVAGETLTRQQLLFPLLLESSNDAATALENSIAPTELVKSMNEFANKHGLTSTTFSDPSGLSERNKSSVSDLVRLTCYIYKNEPHLIDITQLKQYLVSNHGWQNNNPFVSYAAYAGGKHGFTPEAGRTAIAIFDEQFPKNQVIKIGYILLGSTDLKGDMSLLREFVRTNVYYR